MKIETKDVMLYDRFQPFQLIIEIETESDLILLQEVFLNQANDHLNSPALAQIAGNILITLDSHNSEDVQS